MKRYIKMIKKLSAGEDEYSECALSGKQRRGEFDTDYKLLLDQFV